MPTRAAYAAAHSVYQACPQAELPFSKVQEYFYDEFSSLITWTYLFASKDGQMNPFHSLLILTDLKCPTNKSV